MNIEHRTSNIERRIKNNYGAEGRKEGRGKMDEKKTNKIRTVSDLKTLNP